MMMKKKPLAVLMGQVFGLVALAATGVAQAQQATPERITVTGSRISSPNAESPSPLQVFSAEDIASSGVTNVQELLLKNPTMGVPSISRTNSNFQTASVGVATIDLRNLGTARTLVLVNGRRFVSGQPGTSAVDMNSIPTDFIERIDMLTGGASSTYGSDAVAGVVNIILKRNFEGISLDASRGESNKGDDTKQKFGVTFGTAGEKGNVMGHFGYSKQGAVYSRDREMSSVDQGSQMAFVTGDPADAFTVVRPNYSSFAPQGRFFYTGGSYTYDANGNPTTFSTNGTANHPANGFNRSEFRTIAVPTERYIFAATGNYALSENHSAFFEGNYAATKVNNMLEPFPISSTSASSAISTMPIPAEFKVNGVTVRNPIVPDYLYSRLTDTNGDGLKDYTFTRRLSEIGNRGGTVDRDTFRVATGLKGSIFKDWNYEVFTSYGSTKESQVTRGQVNVSNFLNALSAIPNGNGGALALRQLPTRTGRRAGPCHGETGVAPWHGQG